VNKLLLIIPFYNEQKRISIIEFRNAFEISNDIHYLLVNDGSFDSTLSILKEFENQFKNVHVLNLLKNSGKAEAIREGINSQKQTTYDYVGYLDADFSTPIFEMVKLLEFAKRNPSFEIIMGSRIKLLGNTIIRSSSRHYLGRIFATIISKFILKIPVYDTQCGAKIIRMKTASRLFEKPFITRWIFDVEILLRFKNDDAKFLKVSEFPLSQWIEKGNTKIRLKEFVNFPFQLVKIYFHYVK